MGTRKLSTEGYEIDVDCRHVIVHHHLFKNAGSTVDYALRRHFGSAFCTLHASAGDVRLPGSSILAFLEAHPGIAVLSSHHSAPCIPSTFKDIVFDIVSVRHPLLRLDSMYRHHCAKAPVLQLSQAASAREFLQEMLDRHPHLVSNSQVTTLANGGHFRRPVAEPDLVAAQELLIHCAVVCVVERMDESLTVAEYFLQPAFGSLDLACPRQNVTLRSAQLLEQQLDRVRQTWGNRIYEQVERLNQFDVSLWETAQLVLDRRIRLTPEFAEKLQAFLHRVNEVSAQAGGEGSRWAEAECAR